MFRKIGSWMNLENKYLLIKLIVSFVLPMISFVFLIAFITTNTFRSQLIESTDSISRQSLSNISLSFNKVMDSSKVSLYDISRNNNIYKLFLFPDTENKILVREYLKNLMIINKDIHSVYLVKNNQILFSYEKFSNSIESEESVLKFIKSASNFKPVPRIINTGNTARNVFSTVYSPRRAGDYVLINYDADVLYQYFDVTLLKQWENLIIVNKAGQQFFNRDSSKFGTNISDIKEYKSIFQSEEKYGKLALDSEQKYIGNFMKTGNEEYCIFFISQNKALYKTLFDVQFKVTLFSLVVLLLILVFFICILYKLYRPINNLFNNLKDFFYKNQKASIDLNNLQVISDNFLSISKRLNELSEYDDNESNIVKYDFILKIISSGSTLNTEYLTNTIKLLNENMINKSGYFTFTVKIDEYGKFIATNSEEAVGFLLLSIEEMVNEFLKDSLDTLTFNIQNEYILCFAALKNNTGFNTELELEKLLSYMQQITNLSLSIGVGIVFTELTEAHFMDSFRQSLKCVNNRLTVGNGRVISEELLAKTLVRKVNLSNEIKALMSCMNTDSDAEFTQLTKNLIAKLENLDYDFVIDTITKLTISMYNTLSLYPSNEKLSGKFSIDDALVQIKSFDKLSQVENFLYGTYLSVKNVVQDVKNTKAKELCITAEAYIENNYFNCALSAYSLSEMMGITPQYFSRIFKKHTGVSFPEYINNLRLSKAAELLLGCQDFSIGEITTKVGFYDSAYFTTLFKKKYGTSPSKYLNAHLQSKISSQSE